METIICICAAITAISAAMGTVAHIIFKHREMKARDLEWEATVKLLMQSPGPLAALDDFRLLYTGLKAFHKNPDAFPESGWIERAINESSGK